jgi:hypothetical protein
MRGGQNYIFLESEILWGRSSYPSGCASPWLPCWLPWPQAQAFSYRWYVRPMTLSIAVGSLDGEAPKGCIRDRDPACRYECAGAVKVVETAGALDSSVQVGTEGWCRSNKRMGPKKAEPQNQAKSPTLRASKPGQITHSIPRRGLKQMGGPLSESVEVDVVPPETSNASAAVRKLALPLRKSFATIRRSGLDDLLTLSSSHFDPMYGPAARCKRPLSTLADAVLRQCIRSPIGACAPGHHGYQRACDLLSG